MIGYIKYIKQKGYIYYKNSEIESIEDRFMSINLVETYCEKYNCDRVLIDIRGQNPITKIQEEYSFSRAYKRALSHLKLAIVFDAGSVEISFLTEMLQKDLKFNMKRFFDLEEAIDW